MVIPPVGAVVLIDFPFADLKTSKKRPALVIARSSLATVILCQITSRQLPGVPGIKIAKADFSNGGLQIISYARPDKLFTIDASLAGQTQLGLLRTDKLNEIRSKVQSLFDELAGV